MKAFMMRVDEELYRRALAMAKADPTGISLSTYVRRALLNQVARDEKQYQRAQRGTEEPAEN